MEAGDTNLVSFVSAQPRLTIFPDVTSVSIVFTLALSDGYDANLVVTHEGDPGLEDFLLLESSG